MTVVVNASAGNAPADATGGGDAVTAVGAVADPVPGTALVPDVGRGWYPRDVESHRRDAPRYCPHCAAPLSLADGGKGLATEYWVAHERVFVCCCGDCGWYGDIVLSDRVISHEAEH